MPLFIVASLMMAQVAAQPAPQQPLAPQQRAKKQKQAQVCEEIEVTGSRSKRRVCHDQSGNLDLGPGISTGSYGNSGNGGGSSSISGK
jgi:hypothetical protein